jgi:hypothetical protein
MKLLSGLLLSSFILVGCDFEDSDDEAEVNDEGTGFFIDSPVQGLSYTSASHSGTTDAFGRFDFDGSESITFSFGDIILPSVSASKAIHVSDLYTDGLTDTRTINLARLLLTIDSNGDSDDGIQLSADAIDPDITPDNLDFGSATFDADITDYIAQVANMNTLVTIDDAIAHITETKTEVDGLLAGCGNECVPRAAYNEYVDSVSPRHAQTVDADITTLEIVFAADRSFNIDQIQVEMFELPSDTENCRIDWPGLRCGDIGIDSYQLASSVISTSEGGNEYDMAKAINGNTVTLTLSGNSVLSSGKLYVAHIFNDQDGATDDDDYKTWWLFYTE